MKKMHNEQTIKILSKDKLSSINFSFGLRLK